MRFWIKPEERRPDPAPVAVDDRKAFAVGVVAWVVALVVAIVLGPQLPQAWLWTAVAGVVLGAIGLAYTQLKRRRS